MVVCLQRMFGNVINPVKDLISAAERAAVADIRPVIVI